MKNKVRKEINIQNYFLIIEYMIESLIIRVNNVISY